MGGGAGSGPPGGDLPLEPGEDESSEDWFERVRQAKKDAEAAKLARRWEEARRARADRRALMFVGEDPTCRECHALTDGHEENKDGHLSWHLKLDERIARARRAGREVYGGVL